MNLPSHDNTNIPKIYMVLRYDDYTNDSNFRVEREIFKYVSNYGFPLSVAIVAHFGTDPKEVEFITPYIKNGTVEVACHGLFHANFNFISNDSQYYRLEESRRILEEVYNVKIETFVAPGNRYNPYTLQALQELDYKVISATKDQEIENEAKLYPDLIYAHDIWMPWNEGITNFKTLIKRYRSSVHYINDSRALLLCTHFHGVNFVEYPHAERVVPVPQEWIQSNYTEFNDFLLYLSKQNDLEVVTFNQLINITQKVELFNYDLEDPLPELIDYSNYCITLIFVSFGILGFSIFLKWVLINSKKSN